MGSFLSHAQVWGDAGTMNSMSTIHTTTSNIHKLTREWKYEDYKINCAGTQFETNPWFIYYQEVTYSF